MPKKHVLDSVKRERFAEIYLEAGKDLEKTLKNAEREFKIKISKSTAKNYLRKKEVYEEYHVKKEAERIVLKLYGQGIYVYKKIAKMTEKEIGRPIHPDTVVKYLKEHSITLTTPRVLGIPISDLEILLNLTEIRGTNCAAIKRGFKEIKGHSISYNTVRKYIKDWIKYTLEEKVSKEELALNQGTEQKHTQFEIDFQDLVSQGLQREKLVLKMLRRCGYDPKTVAFNYKTNTGFKITPKEVEEIMLNDNIPINPPGIKERHYKYTLKDGTRLELPRPIIQRERK